MTKLLEKAFAAIAQLPELEQDTFAARLLDDIEAEAKWDATFQGSANQLANLAENALKEFRAGQTSPQTDDDLDLSHN